MKHSLLILIALVFVGCNLNKDDINNKSKRNENWVWWVDASTGNARWILINAPNVDPVKNGKFTRFYFNGNVFSKGTRVDGKDVDTTFKYDLNGPLYGYIIYKNNQDTSHYFLRDGPIKLFYADGKIADSGVVKNHSYSDKWISFYDNGKRSYSRDLKNDTGWVTRYYYNGKVEDSDYNEGVNVFDLKHWYDNGQLEYSNEFKNHNKNGKHLQYYRTGQLEGSGLDSSGIRNGEEKLWYEDGKLHSVSHRSNGLLNGTTVVYFENGRVQLKRSDINGKIEGEAKQFDENGRLILDKIFKDGVFIEDKLTTDLLLNHK